MKSIYADDESTWPKDLVHTLEDALPYLKVYEKDRRRIDIQCERDVRLRCDPPSPCEEARRTQLISDMNKELSRYNLVGYHCSRLHPDEVLSIAKNGLIPLCSSLVEQRIEHMVSLGELGDEIADRLKTNNAVNDTIAGVRLGMIWFCFSCTLIRRESGVIRLFRSWGGESLYWAYESDQIVGPILRSIGKPAIVEASIPVSTIETFVSVGERLLTVFLDRRGVVTEREPNFEGYCREAITGENVLEVTTVDSPRFEELTKCSQWRETLR